MFGKSITLFRLFGFRVKMDASWLLLAFLVAWSLAEGLFPHYLPGQSQGVYWFMGSVGVVGLLLSIVLHEFSHSLVARHYGLPIGGISLFLFGGVAEMEDEPPDARTEFLMAVAGPASSLVLAGVFHALQTAALSLSLPVALPTLLFYLAYLNLVLAIFNLLPAFPLDGGRMLRATLWGIGKNLHRATRTAASLGQGFGVGLMVLGVITVLSGFAMSGVWWILIGLFLRSAAENSYGQLRLRESVQGMPARTFMSASPVSVPPDLSMEAFYERFVYRHHYHIYPVMAEGRLLGVVRANAGRAVERSQWARRRVVEFMEPCTDQNCVDAAEDTSRVLGRMLKTGNSRLVVTDGEKLAGVLTFRDLASAQRIRDER